MFCFVYYNERFFEVTVPIHQLNQFTDVDWCSTFENEVSYLHEYFDPTNTLLNDTKEQSPRTLGRYNIQIHVQDAYAADNKPDSVLPTNY